MTHTIEFDGTKKKKNKKNKDRSIKEGTADKIGTNHKRFAFH